MAALSIIHSRPRMPLARGSLRFLRRWEVSARMISHQEATPLANRKLVFRSFSLAYRPQTARIMQVAAQPKMLQTMSHLMQEI